MRQPGGAKDERDAEADEVQPRDPVRTVFEARREEVAAVATAFGGGVQQGVEVAVKPDEYQDGQSDGAPMRSTALTIWIQVVARIPPKAT